MKAATEEEVEKHRDAVQRRGITMPTLEVSDGPQKLSLEGMYLMTKRVIDEWLDRATDTYEWTPAQLIELAGEGRTGDRRTQHEIRLKEIGPLFEQNYVGAIRTDLYEFHIHQLIERCISELEAEQNHLQWALVAARVDRVVASTQRVKKTEPTISIVDFSAVKKSGPIEQGTATIWEEVPNYGLHFSFVFADLLGGDPVDPNATAQIELIPGQSPMAAYAETRQIRDMPRGLRMQWERAERLIREFYGLPIREREELGKLRRRGPRAPRARTSAPAPAAPGAVALEESPGVRMPDPPKAAGVEATVRWLAEQGHAHAAIAKRVKLTAERVAEILDTPPPAPKDPEA